MSKPTLKQLAEFHRQIEAGVVTRASLSVFLKHGKAPDPKPVIPVVESPVLPKGWRLSDESVTVEVHYDDPRWSEMPWWSGNGYYSGVAENLILEDFPKSLHEGCWLVRFRWLSMHASLYLPVSEVLEAIRTSGYEGANRAETETVINAFFGPSWLGFGPPRSSGHVAEISNTEKFSGIWLSLKPPGERICLHEKRVLVVSERKKLW